MNAKGSFNKNEGLKHKNKFFSMEVKDLDMIKQPTPIFNPNAKSSKMVSMKEIDYDHLFEELPPPSQIDEEDDEHHED